ncbi:MAG: hypothetical protein JXQ87_06105 [Bacteroidia bacterium]
MNLFQFCFLGFVLCSCDSTGPSIRPNIAGGGCSYEKSIDTFIIDSFANDSTPFYVLKKNAGHDILSRNMDLIDIYHHKEKDTILFQHSDFYVGKTLIIHEQRIITGACNPYGINSIEIID